MKSEGTIEEAARNAEAAARAPEEKGVLRMILDALRAAPHPALPLKAGD